MRTLLEKFTAIAEQWDDMDVYVGDELENVEINPMTLTPPDEMEDSDQ